MCLILMVVIENLQCVVLFLVKSIKAYVGLLPMARGCKVALDPTSCPLLLQCSCVF